MNRKGIVIILVLVMILALPLNALAARLEMESQTYLNLGDSIAAGMSAHPEQSYFYGYSEYLEGFGFEKVPGIPSVVEDGNIAVPGMTTGDLLGLLEPSMDPIDVTVQGMIMEADVITVSIGGNNILQTMIGAMMGAYGLNPSEATVDELMVVIANRGEFYWYGAIRNVLGNPDFHYFMGQGVEAFNTDWPIIIDQIHVLNPDAHIVVLNMYNPVSKMESPELHQLMEELIQPMNQILRKHQGRRVSVANVYNAFRRNEDAVNFSVAWPPSLDPHPTNIGHQLIVEELMKVRNPRAFR